MGRITSSYPFQALIGDNNGLDQGGSTGYFRPNLLPGVPLLNPLYNSSCPVLTNCQPYVNRQPLSGRPTARWVTALAPMTGFADR
ncbi:hypothetical protein SBA3_4540004 [Candidatus Sulfopaludibacter sp. SbA3]|nr:hypothetical protein SBA3_4540004 [Candidatus Sulfopaludibacter sp. SbA3]